MFLQHIVSSLVHSYIPRNNIYAEDILYPKEVYPIYLQTQCKFNYCMKNKLLKRKNILEFKSILNKSVKQNEFRNRRYNNDVHEIYSKLKSTSISKKHMLMLNSYLNDHFKDLESIK